MTTSPAAPTDRHHDEHDDEHDLGLSHDLPRIVGRNLGRRGLLAMLGVGVGAAALAGCADGSATSSASSATTASRPQGGPGDGGPPPGGGGAPDGEDVEVAEGEIPEETGGPYPADGTNGVNVLTESGIVRRDITTSFGAASGVAEGVPLTVRMRVYDLEGDDVTVLAGAAVYAWQCDREGRYSMYSDDVVDENYLRGVQAADADGWLEFRTVFPGCYAGRWPHVHFEVYPDLAAATSATDRRRTSQLALPQDVCETVYAEPGYEASVANLAGVGTVDDDMVFADGHSLQMATVTGSVDAGFVATLKVPV